MFYMINNERHVSHHALAKYYLRSNGETVRYDLQILIRKANNFATANVWNSAQYYVKYKSTTTINICNITVKIFNF